MLLDTPLSDEHPSVPPIGTAPTDSPTNQVLGDFMGIQAALAGVSVVDSGSWPFPERSQIDHFLRLHQFDTDNPFDIHYLKRLHRDAIVYMTETQRYHLPKDIEHLDDVYDIFMWAGIAPSKRLKKFACMTLKVMHILHHLNSRELVFATAISEADLLARLNTKVFRIIDGVRSAGVHVEEFTTGQKRRSSLITKLLAKKGTLATHIFDRLRFRIIVGSRDDIVVTLIHLMRKLVPFNYVVPQQSQNGLVTCEHIASSLGVTTDWVKQHWVIDATANVPRRGLETASPTPRNEFSGSTYRNVSFVAEIPLRIDDVSPQNLPAIAVCQAEIQLLDSATARANNDGENAHALYKKRQRERVRQRLESACPKPTADQE
jgi:uncharacterized protein (TIGR04552 family)